MASGEWKKRVIAGIAALIVGIVAALLGGSLLTVACACCAVVFVLELLV